MTAPATDPRRRVVDVDSFDELARRPLVSPTNALCLRRAPAGDFAELAHRLAPADGLVAVEPDALRRLRTSPQGRVAADVILDDLARLDALGLDPVLNCIRDYPRDTRGLPIATDVLSFHVDRAPTAVDTWLCTYHGSSTEGLHAEDAVRLVDDPQIRAALRQLHAADHNDHNDHNDDAFEAFLREHSFDLHYRPKANARALALGVGNLWRLAVLWPGSTTTPFIHRAPATTVDDEPRLLLIC
jgi:hypothetical protein